MKEDVNDQDQTNLDDTNGGGGYSKPYVQKKEKRNYWIYVGVILLTLLIVTLCK